MEFDAYSIVLLLLRDDAPRLDPKTEDALQDAHLAHLAALHEAGHLLAAGPLSGNRERRLRGLCIFKGGMVEARVLEEEDPFVRAGVFALEVLPWTVPRGAMRFSPARFPHSSAEAEGD
jgi:hypothetical protein